MAAAEERQAKAQENMAHHMGQFVKVWAAMNETLIVIAKDLKKFMEGLDSMTVADMGQVELDVTPADKKSKSLLNFALGEIVWVIDYNTHGNVTRVDVQGDDGFLKVEVEFEENNVATKHLFDPADLMKNPKMT